MLGPFVSAPARCVGFSASLLSAAFVAALFFSAPLHTIFVRRCFLYIADVFPCGCCWSMRALACWQHMTTNFCALVYHHINTNGVLSIPTRQAFHGIQAFWTENIMNVATLAPWLYQPATTEMSKAHHANAFGPNFCCTQALYIFKTVNKASHVSCICRAWTSLRLSAGMHSCDGCCGRVLPTQHAWEWPLQISCSSARETIACIDQL